MPPPQREASVSVFVPRLVKQAGPLCSQRNWWKKSELQLLKPLPWQMPFMHEAEGPVFTNAGRMVAEYPSCVQALGP